MDPLVLEHFDERAAGSVVRSSLQAHADGITVFNQQVGVVHHDLLMTLPILGKMSLDLLSQVWELDQRSGDPFNSRMAYLRLYSVWTQNPVQDHLLLSALRLAIAHIDGSKMLPSRAAAHRNLLPYEDRVTPQTARRVTFLNVSTAPHRLHLTRHYTRA